tara:strand:- start:2810 stop:3007 length:198 start_codon:yes stop_codon:yes gene_type:complete
MTEIELKEIVLMHDYKIKMDALKSQFSEDEIEEAKSGITNEYKQKFDSLKTERDKLRSDLQSSNE